MKSLAVFSVLVGVLTFSQAKAHAEPTIPDYFSECRAVAVAKVKEEFARMPNYTVDESLANFAGFLGSLRGPYQKYVLFKVTAVKDNGEEVVREVMTQKNLRPLQDCFSL